MPSANAFTVKEIADFLRVSEKTIYRWARQGVIPAMKVQGQYRFERKEIQAWARYKRIGKVMGSEEQAETLEEQMELSEAVQAGGIHYELEGNSPALIFAHMVERFPFVAHMPKSLKQTLITEFREREMLVPTAIGNGIALPHPRHPRDWGIGSGAVGIFFLKEPVDFKAIDGQPIFVMFTILCSTIKGHLKMLSQVSHLLNHAPMRKLLQGIPNPTVLTKRIVHGSPQASSATRR